MKRALGVVSALVVLASGCAGSTSSVASTTTCDELADAHIAARQEYFDHVADISIEEYLELTNRTDGAPPEFLAFDQQTELLEARSSQLGCSAEEIKTLIHDRIDQLQAREPVGEFLIQTYDY